MNKLYAIFGMGAFLMAAFGYGYVLGYRHEAEKFDEYKAKTAAYAEAARENKEEKEKEYARQNATIKDNYHLYSNMLSIYFERLRNNEASSSAVRGTATNPKSANVPTGESSAACNSSRFSICTVTRAFYEGALRDALKLVEIQDWLARQQIPVCR